MSIPVHSGKGTHPSTYINRFEMKQLYWWSLFKGPFQGFGELGRSGFHFQGAGRAIDFQGAGGLIETIQTRLGSKQND